MSSDLNAKALAAATYADCNDNPIGEPCLCQRDGWVSGDCSERHERIGNYVRTYLEASGIGAVVEAAKVWHRAPSLNGWKMQKAEDALDAAVAALEDRTDG